MHLTSYNVIKKRLQQWYIPMNIGKFLRATIEKHLRTVASEFFLITLRQSSEVFCKKYVVRDFAKFTGKLLWPTV